MATREISLTWDEAHLAFSGIQELRARIGFENSQRLGALARRFQEIRDQMQEPPLLDTQELQASIFAAGETA